MRPQFLVPLVLSALFAANGWAWTRVEPESLRPTDLAVLGSGQSRADFPCHVAALKPELGFDLRFHSDYRAEVPVKVLASGIGWWQVLIRITPVDHEGSSVYLAQRFVILDVPPGTNGGAVVAGGFDLGLGRYRVNWMMRDDNGRICSSGWDTEARLRSGQRNFPLTLEPNTAADWESEGDRGPQLRGAAVRPIRLKVLLNVSPRKSWKSILNPEDASVLISMLRGLMRDSGVGSFTLVAFNLREQKILYESKDATSLDLEALAQAVQTRTTGTIDYELLKRPRSETQFATDLLKSQLGAEADAADAVLIVGPKVTLDRKISLEELRAGGASKSPIFYFNYNPDPVEEPWPDTIGAALKAYEGVFAYSIVRPADFGAAMRDWKSREILCPKLSIAPR